jgi:hypothetical protein
MIVYAHRYSDETSAGEEFLRFERWSRAEVPREVSCWRTFTPESEEWFVIVVDESNSTHERYDWQGEPYALDIDQAAAFVQRRLAAKLGAAPVRASYSGSLSKPMLRPDGTWSFVVAAGGFDE